VIFGELAIGSEIAQQIVSSHGDFLLMKEGSPVLPSSLLSVFLSLRSISGFAELVLN